jgi:long-chain fatty acid transport protein
MRLPFYWESSFMYEWGITRYLKQGFSASAGYMFSQSSVPAASFSPAVPDSDRHIFSFGLGQQYKWCRWDTAYQFAYGPPRSINNSVNGPTVAGRYRFISHALALTIRFTY